MEYKCSFQHCHSLQPPQKGAYVVVNAALSKDLEGLGGNYIRETTTCKVTTAAQDEEVQRQLWSVTHKMIADVEARI